MGDVSVLSHEYKTASDLLQRFGTLEDVLASIDEISGAKRKQNLTEHADNARISKQLATINREVPGVEIDPQAVAAQEPDRSKLRDVFLARARVGGLRAQLDALSPRATLARGYAIVRVADGIVRDARSVAPGDALRIELHRGQLTSRVEAVEPES